MKVKSKPKKEVPVQPAVPLKTAEEDMFRLVWKEPQNVETDVSDWHVWWTKCGRYRVVRSISKYDPEVNYFAASYGKHEVLSKHRSLIDAFRACRAHHVNQNELNDEDVFTNEKQMERQAEAGGLDLLPQKQRVTKPSYDSESEDEDMATATKTKPANNKKAPAAKPVKKEGPAGRPSHMVEGHSVTSLLRWIGKNGWTTEAARKVLKKYRIELAESTIISQVLGGKNGTRGTPAELDKPTAAKISAILGPKDAGKKAATSKTSKAGKPATKAPAKAKAAAAKPEPAPELDEDLEEDEEELEEEEPDESDDEDDSEDE